MKPKIRNKTESLHGLVSRAPSCQFNSQSFFLRLQIIERRHEPLPIRPWPPTRYIGHKVLLTFCLGSQSKCGWIGAVKK